MPRPPAPAPFASMLGAIIGQLRASPRPVDQIAAAGLTIGAELAAGMQRHMIATAPDQIAANGGAPPRAAQAPAKAARVEVITVDASKLSQPRKR